MKRFDRKLTFSTKIPFGKYKGISVYDIIKEHNDIKYIKWLIPKWKV